MSENYENRKPSKEEAKEMTVEQQLGKDKGVDTTFKKLSEVIKLKLEQLEDWATQETKMPIASRLKERIKSIEKISKAQHRKIEGQHKTFAPKIHIRNLEARKINNEEGEIIFEVYEMDENGNKKLYENKTVVTLANGEKVERVTSAEYRISHKVREYLKHGKPVQREVIKLTE